MNSRCLDTRLLFSYPNDGPLSYCERGTSWNVWPWSLEPMIFSGSHKSGTFVIVKNRERSGLFAVIKSVRWKGAGLDDLCFNNDHLAVCSTNALLGHPLGWKWDDKSDGAAKTYFIFHTSATSGEIRNSSSKSTHGRIRQELFEYKKIKQLLWIRNES